MSSVDSDPVDSDNAEQDATERQFTYLLPGSYEFQDHSGEIAVSFYIGRAAREGKEVLPPLWSYQVYAVYEDADLFDVAQTLAEVTKHSMVDVYSYRVDAYRVAGGTLEECMAHYLREKASRKDTARAIPYYQHCTNYLIYLNLANWKGSTCTAAAWDETLETVARQDDIMAHAPRQVFAGENGFVSAGGQGGNLGDALMSLFPERGEDPDYEEALYDQKESWDTSRPFERNPDYEFVA